MLRVCKNGHPLTGDNVAIQKGGNSLPYVTCRQCNKDRAKEWRKKNAHRLGRKWSGHGNPGQTLICR